LAKDIDMAIGNKVGSLRSWFLPATSTPETHSSSSKCRRHEEGHHTTVGALTLTAAATMLAEDFECPSQAVPKLVDLILHGEKCEGRRYAACGLRQRGGRISF
jgi:hypothetical protein